jgi:CO/xanthine dehydrogenase FAD-binding subunit
MDLNTIDTLVRPAVRRDLPAPARGDAFLAGGTWLFSEPQRELVRLIDLPSLGWIPIAQEPDRLVLAATCTLAGLDAWAADAGWAAADMVRRCCRALWGSFKICNAATIGGNLCLALPAAPMAALTIALEATCVVWSGLETDRIPADRFILGPQRTCLAPGAVLRQIEVPSALLSARFALRQASLTVEGRSAALLIGRLDRDGFALAITASVPRPLSLRFDRLPDGAALRAAIEAASAADGWYDDVHGAPDWRRHMTLRLAGEILAELAA